ncbi:PRKR-interacting protein 1 -like protein [Trichinella papuae]|uniref:PRKR-interacting protein 1-like protein n=1 Tax=Trichinella papuae TaxID=268474 RepID=A0A0V1N5Z0_9BILA|nr:PRKR-interacting protein 1 -like protein [Trichinella papuae]
MPFGFEIMNRRRFHKDDDDDDSYLRGAKTAMDEQRRRLEKLLQNIEKPAYIPEKPKEWKPEPPPEFVRNVVRVLELAVENIIYIEI